MAKKNDLKRRATKKEYAANLEKAREIKLKKRREAAKNKEKNAMDTETDGVNDPILQARVDKVTNKKARRRMENELKRLAAQGIRLAKPETKKATKKAKKMDVEE